MNTDDLDDGLLPPTEQAPTEDHQNEGEQSEELHFPTVYAFVEAFLAPIYARYYEPTGGSWKWCSRWWDHPEAVSRLEALWLAFETLRREPGTGAAMWWRDFADPIMATLTDPQGPFSQCKAGERHKLPPALPVAPAPASLTTDSTALAGAWEKPHFGR